LCSFLHCSEHTLTSCFSIPRLPTQPKKYINLHLHTFGQYI
jgi:cytochrome c553